ncbi:hypothetical protein SCAB_48081 [Streptomyces scabiei 87.22]|uniref:Holin n=1 Tax=Streptomyces scabiei (strain 87.22) TaxID=680198 RepID=C9ZDT5_STRSW|nr:hypothetical protein [Streptomyces scabiei]MDX2892513.1 hypothetical protein [Streptomyces scabiei]MDX2900606.1 hypothetical protein [Streptomyces scabiei]MDX2994138.1 hypothetical protein [Streptomyces scabiei]MDX3084780.1 hypothetical protein [Streptomyces scabiei]MDX3137908.1 hypothetical protein [Streptomyces scabiei]
MRISKYAKAVVAALAAGAGSLSVAVTDDVVSAAEGWAALIAVLAALGFTWAVPNRQDGEADG